MDKWLIELLKNCTVDSTGPPATFMGFHDLLWFVIKIGEKADFYATGWMRWLWQSLTAGYTKLFSNSNKITEVQANVRYETIYWQIIVGKLHWKINQVYQQIIQSLVQIVGRLSVADGHVENWSEILERELIHWVDLTERSNDKEKDGAASCHWSVSGQEKINQLKISLKYKWRQWKSGSNLFASEKHRTTSAASPLGASKQTPSSRTSHALLRCLFLSLQLLQVSWK